MVPGPDPFPTLIDPMKATPGEHLPLDDSNWAYELKWDGIRAVAFIGAGGVEGVRLQSRSLRDITPQYPELAGLSGSTPLVLDGEVVAFNDQGKPSFERLQSRINLASPRDVARKGAEVPVVYMAFDLLHLDGQDLMSLPYTERRSRLESLGLGGPHLQTPRHHVGDGAALLAATRDQGLEGLVAKRLDSAYLPGRRSSSWIKVKNFLRQEMVVGGWLAGEGNRSGRLGALLVGHYDDGRLRYAGRVGTGFNDAELARLGQRLAPLTRDAMPFAADPPVPPLVRRRGQWVAPELVVEVAFREWTAAGTLRAPSYKGEHRDRDPGAVGRET